MKKAYQPLRLSKIGTFHFVRKKKPLYLSRSKRAKKLIKNLILEARKEMKHLPPLKMIDRIAGPFAFGRFQK